MLRRRVALLCLLLPLLLAGYAWAQQLRAAGDAKQSFLTASGRPSSVSNTLSGPAAPLYWTEISRRGASDTAWKPFSGVVGLPADLTVHRGQLLLLMGDGSWRGIYEGGSTSGETLPSQANAKLVMLAGEGPSLLAYATEVGGAGHLLRLEGAQWVDLGPAPETPVPAAADLAVFGDRVFLAVPIEQGIIKLYRTASLAPATTRPATRSSSRPTTLATASSPLAWEPLGTIDAKEKIAGVRLVPLGTDPAKDIGLWADPGEENGGAVYRWQGGDTWDRAFSLGPVNGELAASLGTLRFYSGQGASNAPGATRPAVDPKTGKPDLTAFEYAVSYDGQFVGKPLPIGEGSMNDFVRGLGELIVGMATAGLMAAIILWWRKREYWTQDVVVAAQALPLAPVGRRLLAGIIDVLPWLGMLAYLFFHNDIVVNIPPFKTRDSVFLLLYAYATVLTHTTICELIFGRTLGMAVAGLRVTDMQGNRATPGAIVVRNLCRAIDMVLVAPYLAVFTSPLNQSLGDASAGTLVLTRDSATIPPDPTSTKDKSDKP